MKYVKMTAIAELMLKEDASIVENPDGEGGQCLKIGENYYNAEVLLMKYDNEGIWEVADLEDVADTNYVMYMDSEFEELTEMPEKPEKPDEDIYNL